MTREPTKWISFNKKMGGILSMEPSGDIFFCPHKKRLCLPSVLVLSVSKDSIMSIGCRCITQSSIITSPPESAPDCRPTSTSENELLLHDSAALEWQVNSFTSDVQYLSTCSKNLNKLLSLLNYGPLCSGAFHLQITSIDTLITFIHLLDKHPDYGCSEPHTDESFILPI